MQKNNLSSTILPTQIFLLLLISIPSMAADSSSPETKVYIVYTERHEGLEPEVHHTKTLASVFGSEDAAKEALVYSYKNAASGFSAKLTPDQVTQLSKQPGVLQVVESQTLHLHSGPGRMQV
ncbi:hypothetical protein CASFOL_021776 [Castilleja foliolosa]|uniref:Inhibitor I9 domain-containing protein n=1 Tax=Castilleja foliolosa TaxID=1961234 RepID=A0ABD3CYF4_9LAMI